MIFEPGYHFAESVTSTVLAKTSEINLTTNSQHHLSASDRKAQPKVPESLFEKSFFLSRGV
jgi:hypothetical protein